ncbi:MAG: DUF1904 family protein [Gemella sp.]|nr:DUF1904 family protein [Gemella sp.]
MPRIVTRGIKKEDVKELSTVLLDTIETIIDRPKSAFTLEAVEATSYFDGEEAPLVYVEVSWKARPTEVCKEVAEAITPLIKDKGYEKVFVYFKELDLEKEFTL